MNSVSKILSHESVLAPRKVWAPLFLKEKRVRTALESLYVSIVLATENAELIRSLDVESMQRATPYGTDLAKTCFRFYAEWLSRMKELAASETIYQSRWVQPLRCASEFLIRARNFEPPSTSVRGLLISKSKDYPSRTFGGMMNTLTVVVPELRSSMALKCRADDVSDLAGGSCTFGNVQPIPIVNRLHPTGSLRVTKDRDFIYLHDCDFLMLSLLDTSGFRNSLAFEQFCVIECKQQMRNRLGAVVICSGMVSSVAFPTITLRSIVDPERNIELIITPEALRWTRVAGTKLESLRGKFVRFLLVIWYGYGMREDKLPMPELLQFEQINREQVILDDLIGFIRLRTKVDSADLFRRYPSAETIVKEGKLSCIKGAAEAWRYDPNSSEPQDSLKRDFVTTNESLKSGRDRSFGTSGECWIEKPYNLMDWKRLTAAGLVDRLKHDADLINCFLRIIKTRDDTDNLPKSINALIKSLGDLDENVTKSVRWLHDYGFILVGERGLYPNNQSLRIAESACSDKLRTFLLDSIRDSGSGVIYVGHLEQKSVFPPSFIINYLKSLEDERLVQCYQEQGHRCELLWIAPKSDSTSETELARMEKVALENAVLSILLAAVNYPLKISKILEDLDGDIRIPGNLILHLLLSNLLSQRRVEQDSEKMWGYPWPCRIRDILKGSSDPLTLTELMDEARIPVIEQNRSEVERIVKSLSISDRITTIPKSLRTGVIHLLQENRANAFDIAAMNSKLSLQSTSDDDAIIRSLLLELENSGIAFRLPDGRWTYSFRDNVEKNERLLSILKWDCVRYVISKLINGPSQKTRLESELRIFMIQQTSKLAMDTRQSRLSAQDIILSLKKDGTLLEEQDRYKILSERSRNIAGD